MLEGLETLDRSYRAALCVPRAPQDHRELLVLNTRAGATTHPPLFDDYASFLINLLGIQCESVRPVFQDLERGGYHLGRVGWDLKHVPGLVEAGRGVQVRAHPHADRLHELNQLLLLEVLGPVEGHMFEKVGEPKLVFVLEHRARLDHQAELSPVRRLTVFADEVAETVLELPNRDVGSDRHGLIQGAGAGMLQSRVLPRLCDLPHGGSGRLGPSGYGGDGGHGSNSHAGQHRKQRL